MTHPFTFASCLTERWSNLPTWLEGDGFADDGAE